MTTKTKKIETPHATAWDALLVAARAIYFQEAERLAEELKPRILMGEFSDHDSENDDNIRYLNLAHELDRDHPWLQTEQSKMVVFACSDWPEKHQRILDRQDLVGDLQAPEDAGEVMACDVLNTAADRGWVKPLRAFNAAEYYSVRIGKPLAA